MTTTNAASPPRLLLVDDDHVSLIVLGTQLKRRGYGTVTAGSVAEAKAVLRREGPGAFAAVVSDYKMPGATGIHLLEWLQETDDTLAAIIVTADLQRKLAADSMRLGAVDFVEKPLRVPEFLKAVERAIGTTRQRRDLRRAKSAMHEIAVVQQAVLNLHLGAFPGRLDVAFHPKQDAGGDLAALFPLGRERLLLLVTDVSGHDVKAAFVASYFQGIVRGMVEKSAPIDEIFSVFNRFLIREWNRRGNWHAGSTVETSVSACAIEVDLAARTLRILNCGSPAPLLVRPDAPAEAARGAVQSPLGWFEPIGAASAMELWPEDRILVWTDGLEELAGTLDVDPLALAVDLRRARNAGDVPPYLGQARDDVLAIVLDLSEQPAAGRPVREILIHRSIAGDWSHRVDELQETWSRSLSLVLPGLGEAQLFNVLLATREAVLNALQHGCEGRSDRRATVQVEWWPVAETVVVRVLDPGAGFAPIPPATTRAAAEAHRGLGLIGELADEVKWGRGGAELTLTFHLKSPASP